MSVILFRLNGAAFDEAEDIRELLETNDIDYYETSEGRWGFSVAAFWLKDPSLLPHARQLIDQYQQQRIIRVREEYQRLKEQGKIESVWDRIKMHTVLFILTLILIGFILFVSVKPFIDFF